MSRFSTEMDASTAPLQDRLIKALAIVQQLPKEPTEKDIKSVLALYEQLKDIHREVPKVRCWCVVKFYSENPKGLKGHSWEPRVWTGHTTKAQADEFAPAIEKHYQKGRANHDGDRFKVLYRECSFPDLMEPDISAEQFCKRLGS